MSKKKDKKKKRFPSLAEKGFGVFSTDKVINEKKKRDLEKED